MIRQAIITKYIPHSNALGSRVKASCAAKAIYMPWDNELNVEENHTKAAQRLAERLGWVGHWYGGAMANGKGNCYVCVCDTPEFSVAPPKTV